MKPDCLRVKDFTEPHGSCFCFSEEREYLVEIVRVNEDASGRESFSLLVVRYSDEVMKRVGFLTMRFPVGLVVVAKEVYD